MLRQALGVTLNFHFSLVSTVVKINITREYKTHKCKNDSSGRNVVVTASWLLRSQSVSSAARTVFPTADDPTSKCHYRSVLRIFCIKHKYSKVTFLKKL